MDSIKAHRPPSCHAPGVSPAISLAGQSLRLGTGWAQILIPDPLLCRSILLHRKNPLTVSSTEDAKRKKNAKIANTTQGYPNGGIESRALKGTVTPCGLRAA